MTNNRELTAEYENLEHRHRLLAERFVSLLQEHAELLRKYNRLREEREAVTAAMVVR